MNFIILILMFAITSVLSIFFSGQIFHDDTSSFLYLVGVGTGIGSVVSIFLMVFQIIDLTQDFNKEVFKIITLKKNIELSKERLGEYVDKLAESMTTLYPKFEKEIFKDISPENAGDLKKYLAEYPELKFNTVLIEHIKSVNSLTDKVYKDKIDLEKGYNKLRNYYTNRWLLKAPKIADEELKDTVLNG